MVEGLKRGDKVNIGGIYGKVSRVIDDNDIEVEIDKDNGVKVRVVRSAVSQLVGKPEPANDDKK